MIDCAPNKLTAINLQQHAVVNIVNVTPRDSLSAVEIAANSVADRFREVASRKFNREEVGISTNSIVLR